MYLVLLLSLTIGLQLSTFSAACNQAHSGASPDGQVPRDDTSAADGRDELLTHWSQSSQVSPATSTTDTQTAATTTTTATTTTLTSSLNSSSTTQPTDSRISPADIHSFRLEYNKYKILSHLSITGNLDQLTPEIDSNLRDKLVTSTKFNDQPTSTIGSRHKRSLSCDEVKSDKDACCLENFYVNFTHIGWDKWILYPTGYNANYCRGQCDLSHARYYHSTLLSKYSNLISLCCSPKQMAPLKLLYIDEENKVHQKSIPDMIVESCDCA